MSKVFNCSKKINEFGIVQIIDVPIIPGKNESAESLKQAKSDRSTERLGSPNIGSYASTIFRLVPWQPKVPPELLKEWKPNLINSCKTENSWLAQPIRMDRASPWIILEQTASTGQK